MSKSFGTPWNVACQVPLSMEFSTQEYWSGVPFPSPGVLPDPGIKPASPALAGGFFTTEPLVKIIQITELFQIIQNFPLRENTSVSNMMLSVHSLSWSQLVKLSWSHLHRCQHAVWTCLSVIHVCPRRSEYNDVLEWHPRSDFPSHHQLVFKAMIP